MLMEMKPNGEIDLKRSGRSLISDDSLQSAVIISLLSDRRAAPDDALPSGKSSSPIPDNRRGWAGDAFYGDRIGSRLWLLEREKQTEEVRRRAMHYATEALQWLIDDGHATGVAVMAEWSERGRLDLKVDITLPDGKTFKTIVKQGVYAI